MFTETTAVYYSEIVGESQGAKGLRQSPTTIVVHTESSVHHIDAAEINQPTSFVFSLTHTCINTGTRNVCVAAAFCTRLSCVSHTAGSHVYEVSVYQAYVMYQSAFYLSLR